jgi:small subunit ribosomal protein S36
MLVWLLTGLQALLLVSHSLLVPTWRGPDEPKHVDLVVALIEGRGYPAYDQRTMDPGIRRSHPLVRYQEGSRHLRRDEAMPRRDRPSRAELEERAPPTEVELRGGDLNHMAQHPPSYYVYLAAASVVTDALAPGAGLGSYDREVATMRLLSLVLAVPLPLLAWASGRAAGASQAISTAAAVIPLGIPQLTHVGSVVNNDTLLILVMGVLTVVAVRFAAGHVTRRGVVAAGVLTGLALLVKAFAFVVPVWLLVAIVWGRRRGGGWPSLVGLYVGTTFLAGGWWWLWNLLRHGALHPSLEYANRLAEKPAGMELDVSGWLGDWLPSMSNRFWGSFGWVEVPLPAVWTTSATVVVVVGVVAALAGGRRLLPRKVAVALALPTLLLAGLVFLSGFRLYRISAVAAMVQGRYLFGGVIGLSALVAVGLSRLLGRRERLLPALLLLAAAAMQLRAVAALLEAFWGEEGSGVVEGLAAAGAWSPWSPWVLLGLAGLGITAVVATGLTALRFAGLGRRQATG